MPNLVNKSKESLVFQRQEDAHYRVMKALERNPDLTQRELSKVLGVSLGKLNYCLKALIDKGWVKVGNFSHSKNKMNYAYLLTPKGISEKARMTQGFLNRKIEEYEALRAEINLLKNEILGSEETR